MIVILLFRMGKTDAVDVIFYVVAALGFTVAAVIPLFDKKAK